MRVNILNKWYDTEVATKINSHIYEEKRADGTTVFSETWYSHDGEYFLHIYDEKQKLETVIPWGLYTRDWEKIRFPKRNP